MFTTGKGLDHIVVGRGVGTDVERCIEAIRLPFGSDYGEVSIGSRPPLQIKTNKHFVAAIIRATIKAIVARCRTRRDTGGNTTATNERKVHLCMSFGATEKQEQSGKE